jgi:outer membrane protein assembly factor BamB
MVGRIGEGATAQGQQQAGKTRREAAKQVGVIEPGPGHRWVGVRVLAGGLLFFLCAPPDAQAAKGPRRVVTAPQPSEAPPVAANPTPVPAVSPDRGWHLSDEPGPRVAPTVCWALSMGAPVVWEIVSDGTLIYGAQEGAVWAVSRDGVERWRSAIKASGNLALINGKLIAPVGEGRVVAMNPNNGLILEEWTSGGPVIGAPVAVGGEPAWVNAYGAVAGASGWTVQASDSASAGPASDGSVVVFPTNTAELISVQRDRVRWRARLPGPGEGQPVIGDELVYVAYIGEEGRPGGVLAVHPETGLEVWRTPIDEDPTGGLSLGKALLVGDREGTLVGLDPKTGDRLWVAPIDGGLTTVATQGRFGAFVGNADGRVHRFDVEDGGEGWRVKLPATVTSGPLILDDRLYVGLVDGTLACLGEP